MQTLSGHSNPWLPLLKRILDQWPVFSVSLCRLPFLVGIDVIQAIGAYANV